MRTFKERWEGFKEDVVPKKASEEQVNAMKMSFYAGAFSHGNLLSEIALDDLSDNAFDAIVHEIEKEIQDELRSHSTNSEATLNG